MYEQVEEIKDIKTAPTTQPQVMVEMKAKEDVEAAEKAHSQVSEQVEEIKEIEIAPTTQPQVKDEEKAKENVEAAQSEIFAQIPYHLLVQDGN